LSTSTGKTFIAGSEDFEMKKIEVFEITVYVFLYQILLMKALTLFAPVRQLQSRSFWDFPMISAVRNLLFLWSCRCSDFEAKRFDRRCNGRTNTQTVIADTDEDIFGGFTPIALESSRRGKRSKDSSEVLFKCDASLTGFLFTVKNPHRFPARTFALRTEKKDEVILYDSDMSAVFNDITFVIIAT
jgi:hypothetical protein